MNWHLQDAKNHLSKLVQRARDEGPQTITLRGKPAAVVVSVQEYEALAAKKPDLVEYLLSMPELDEETVEAINYRPKHPTRPIDL